ncbi:hypothetical protein D3C71_1667260 [compost metagenome]
MNPAAAVLTELYPAINESLEPGNGLLPGIPKELAAVPINKCNGIIADVLVLTSTFPPEVFRNSFLADLSQSRDRKFAA